MGLLKGLAITFSMYSKIPVPIFEWKEEDMKYSMVFFPLIGIVIGGVYIGWYYAAASLGFGRSFTAAIAAVLPLVITGGIHMDGFLDTVDALSSYQSREVKLKILKDPHCGAFAVIGGLMYILILFGALTEIKELIPCLLIAFGFVLSRALSGLSLIWFPNAKKEGTLHTFSSAAQKKVTAVVLSGTVIVMVALMFIIGGVKGMVPAAAAILVFVYYRRMSDKKFGGITGDLAGFFLQLCELFVVISCAVLYR